MGARLAQVGQQAAKLPPGFVIDDLYVIRGRLGVGGMAAVYDAWQSDAQRPVAVKVIEPGLEEPRALKRRFFNELLLATRIRHPNVVEIHDFGLMGDDGVPYIVMERLTGCSLAEHLRRDGPLAPERAAPLFLGALSALRIAHELGVVHKDLKPSNLFLTSGAEPSLVVLDFGIARRVRKGHGEREYSGTPRYSPPEYLLHHQVAPTLDVYQMGLALVEALTGRPLITTSDPDVAAELHAAGAIRLPVWLSRNPLAPVIECALAARPEDRYPNAGRMQDALAEVAGSGSKVTLRHTDPPAPVRLRMGEVDPDANTVLWGGPAGEPGEAELLDATDPRVASVGPPLVPGVVGLGFGFAAGVAVTWLWLG